MKALIKTLCNLITLCVLLLPVGTLSGQANLSSNDLRDLLLPTSCQRACIFGVETNKTTLQELQQIATVLGSDLVLSPISQPPIGSGIEEDGVFTLTLPPTTSFVVPNAPIEVSLKDGVVGFVLIPAAFSTDLAVQAFGSPTQTFVVDDEVELIQTIGLRRVDSAS
jgi:hypothetical protein